MSSYPHTSAKHGGVDNDTLNLPSFTDLVSFQKTRAQAESDDPSLSPRHRRENEVVTRSQHGHTEDSFQLVSIKRASHQGPPDNASHYPRRIERQAGHSQQTQQDYADATSIRSRHSGLAPSYAPRVATYHDRKLDARDNGPHDARIHEVHRKDRAEAYAVSRHEDLRRERALASQEMVRSSNEYRPVAPFPNQDMPARTENPSTIYDPRGSDNERRTLPTQAIPTRATRADPRTPEHIQDRHWYRMPVDRNMDGQRRTERFLTRIQPSEGKHHQRHRSLRDQGSSFEKHAPFSRQFPQVSSSHHQAPSPRLPIPHNQNRMFDYSCARLPPDVRVSSPSMSMRPPASTFRVVHPSTGPPHHAVSAKEREDQRHRMTQIPKSPYTEEERMYCSQRGSDNRDQPSRSRDREARNGFGGQHHDREGARSVVRETPTHKLAHIDPARRGPPSLDDRQTCAVAARPDHHVRPTSSISDQRHASGSAKPVAVDRAHGASHIATGPISLDMRSHHRLPSRPHDRHCEIRNSVEPSLNDGRQLDEHQVHHQRRVQAEHAVPSRKPVQYATQQGFRPKENDHRSVYAREGFEMGHERLPPALPRPRSVTPAPSALHRAHSQLVRPAFPSSDRCEGPNQLSKYSGEHLNAVQRRLSASPRDQTHTEASYHRQHRSSDTTDRHEHPPPQQRHEGSERYIMHHSDDSVRRTAGPASHQRGDGRAGVNGSRVPPPERLAPATSVHRTERLMQHLLRENVDRLPEGPHHTPQAREASIEEARSRYTPHSDVPDSSPDRHEQLRIQQTPSAQLASIDHTQIMHRSRALPPVIASQHKSLQAHPLAAEQEQHPSAPVESVSAPPLPPGPRTLKRHRADSDTSLVVKASRFTRVDDVQGEALGRSGSSRIVLPSPPRHGRPEREVVPLHGRTDVANGMNEPQRFFGPQPHEQGKGINGSAPITPPLSST